MEDENTCGDPLQEDLQSTAQSLPYIFENLVSAISFIVVMPACICTSLYRDDTDLFLWDAVAAIAKMLINLT
jgi:hypothetical protein